MQYTMAVEITTTRSAHFFRGKLPGTFIFEDEHCVAFDEEENVQAPIHFLVVPKTVIPRLTNTTEDDAKLLGHLLVVANNIATKKGICKNGYHVVVDENYRDGRINSLHIFGRALHHMIWPVGPGARL